LSLNIYIFNNGKRLLECENGSEPVIISTIKHT